MRQRGAVDYTVVIRRGNFKLPKTYLPSEMAQPRTRDGSTTSMPDIGIPVYRNRNDTGVGSQSRSSDSRSQTFRTPEERIQAIAVERVERDTLVVILEQHCREIEQLISNRGRRSILNHLKTQIHIRLDQVRDAHFLYNKSLWEAKKPMQDAYNYIIGIEIRVRGVSQQVDHYLDDRCNSPASTATRATRNQANEESFFTMDENCYSSRPKTPDPSLRQSMDRTNDRYRFETSRPVSTIGIPPTSEYNPRPLQQSGRGGPLPPLMPSLSSDDWINRRTPPPPGRKQY
ncbi:hypothetical protein OUZ56_021891 [Daphnia magna]|uniref:Uncharacterized protein n=1 Tax=Daphnia magna TaxID=35525 RepID=A0ABR0AUQ8_9CRUS|nr:hypothetical protein OUZ56_021891 [Daphnia magna]